MCERNFITETKEEGEKTDRQTDRHRDTERQRQTNKHIGTQTHRQRKGRRKEGKKSAVFTLISLTAWFILLYMCRLTAKT